MQRRSTTTLLRQLNRSAVVDLIRRDGVISPSNIAQRLKISLPTVMRVLGDLIDEGLVEHDGFDEAVRGRPPARVKYRGDAHAIIGVEAMRGKFYGAVSDLNGRILTEMSTPAGDDGESNVEQLADLVQRLKNAPRPAHQAIRGIGIAVPSIVRQPEGLVVLTMGLGWRYLPLRQILSSRFAEPVYVENGRNLAAVGEWGFGTGHKKGSVVSLSIGPGAGAGIVIDGKLYRGRSQAAGEVAWYLDDPTLTGHAFRHLGNKQALRFGPGISDDAIAALEDANRRYVAGELSLDAFSGSVADQQSFAVVRELLDYATMAVASISALINPEIIIIAGKLVRGAPLAIDVLRERLRGNVYDPPRIALSELGHRDVVMGAIMMVLDATTLNPTDAA